MLYNTNDWALTLLWRPDQNLKLDRSYDWVNVPDKPERYYYTELLGNTRRMCFPDDTYEIFSFITEDRCEALGARAGVEGVFTGSQVDLQTLWPPDAQPGLDYGTHVWHSAQLHSTNMKQKEVWSTLLGPLCFDLKGKQ